jgi:hypothetical protein
MPHILGGAPSSWPARTTPCGWRSFLPDPTPSRGGCDAVVRVYGTAPAGSPAAPFFDLLAIHELGHAFTSQAGSRTQRLWMGEFLPNLILHAWVEEAAPELLPALTLLPDLVVAPGLGATAFTTLAELEENYALIGRQHPGELRLVPVPLAPGGPAALRGGWERGPGSALGRAPGHPGPLDDEAFVELLDPGSTRPSAPTSGTGMRRPGPPPAPTGPRGERSRRPGGSPSSTCTSTRASPRPTARPPWPCAPRFPVGPLGSRPGSPSGTCSSAGRRTRPAPTRSGRPRPTRP